MAKSSSAQLKLIAALEDRASGGLKALDQQLASVQKRGVLNIKSFGALDQAAGSFGMALQGDLGALTRFAGGAGLLALAAGAGKVALDLGNMGEQSAQVEARFRAFNGGAMRTTRALDPMNRAVGLALTDDEQMAASSQLMASGIAKSAEEAGRLAQAALYLGDANENALGRIEGLNRALASGRVASLIPYGVNLDQLRQRTEELQKANSGLTDSQALTQAFMEQAGTLMQRVQQEGGKAVTATQEFQNAWKNMKDAVAARVAPTITVIVKTATQAVTGVTESLDPIRQAEAEVARLEQALAARQAQLATVSPWTSSQTAITQLQRDVDETSAALDQARVRLFGLQAATQDWGAASMVAVGQVTDGFAALVTQVGSLEEMLTASAWASSGGDFYLAMYKANLEQQRKDAEAAVERRRQAKQDAQDRARDYERALQTTASHVQGWISEAMNASKGLFNVLPGTGENRGPFAPGANGPFENIYRMLDVAKQGAASPWMAGLGLTQEQARKLAEDWEAGIITPAIEALMDPEKLKVVIERQRLAEETQKAFAEKWGIVLQGGLEQAVTATHPAAYQAGLLMAQAILGGFKTGIPAPGQGGGGAGGPGSTGVHAPGGGYAAGGWTGGGWALVGEAGPEVVNLPRGSRVYSSQESRGMFGSRVTNNIVNRAGDLVVIRDTAAMALYIETLRTKRLARLAEQL